MHELARPLVPAAIHAIPVLSFGDLLRGHRLAASLTQAALAERAGISARGIQDLERGLRQPHRATVLRLEAALQLSPGAQVALRHATTPRPRQRLPAWLQVVSRAKEVATAPRHNLPAQLTSFIGRGAVLAEAIRLLGGPRPASRLVTLTGTAGVGKTRLALEVAAALAGSAFPDGVWLVELAPLTDACDAYQAVVAALGLRAEPGSDKTSAEILLGALRIRKLLLVLDNCEHLVQACADLAHDILRSCPAVSILATSRESLGILGETTVRLAPLACPAPGALDSLDELRQCEAVRLFVERASAVCADFALSEANAAAVAAICEQLDGIPLGLELAAARVRALSVEQIAGRLDQCFRVLVDGNRAGPPRQRTLEAALFWSYARLNTPEQQLFSRLGAFAGAWSLEAAEEICAGDGIASEQVLHLLARLIEKSLVVAEDGPAHSQRYRLLEPLRQFALERLRDWSGARAVPQVRA